jgi:hypothetical protein
MVRACFSFEIEGDDAFWLSRPAAPHEAAWKAARVSARDEFLVRESEDVAA